MAPDRVVAAPAALHRAAALAQRAADGLAEASAGPGPGADLPGAEVAAAVAAVGPHAVLRDRASELAGWARDVRAAADALSAADDRAAGGL